MYAIMLCYVMNGECSSPSRKKKTIYLNSFQHSSSFKKNKTDHKKIWLKKAMSMPCKICNRPDEGESSFL